MPYSVEKKPVSFNEEIESIRKRFQGRIVALGPKFLKKKAA